ncbi:hypothetical protein G5V65_04190 [Rhodobacter sp. HX-7-19]|jgi:hypothetical protein|uniref:Uncharacterized protein n=1 Tax=Paragemmobacter kunshanensis TaxID=2583234 RepID=A0A6M1TXV0_9RHOB|nr:hypothetical protein [Rhodobacter kunshanensis]NGQ90084.1 hypothetical protein [Rhodobacter kunshanensis]
MNHAINELNANAIDPMFGRSYAARGDVMPEFRMPQGWWLVPAVLGGAAGWAALISAAFF